jgi:hypothetical protein
VTDFVSLAATLEDCFEKSLCDLSEILRQRFEGDYLGEQLAAEWDASTAKKRRRLVAIWDYLHNPDPVVTTPEEWLLKPFCELPEALRQSLEGDFVEGRWNHHGPYERRKMIQFFDYKLDPDDSDIKLKKDSELLESIAKRVTEIEKRLNEEKHQAALARQSTTAALTYTELNEEVSEDQSGFIKFRDLRIELTRNIRSKEKFLEVMNILSRWPIGRDTLQKRKPNIKPTQENIAKQIKDLLDVDGDKIEQDVQTILIWRRELIRKNRFLKKDLPNIFG